MIGYATPLLPAVPGYPRWRSGKEDFTHAVGAKEDHIEVNPDKLFVTAPYDRSAQPASFGAKRAGPKCPETIGRRYVAASVI